MISRQQILADFKRLCEDSENKDTKDDKRVKHNRDLVIQYWRHTTSAGLDFKADLTDSGSVSITLRLIVCVGREKRLAYNTHRDDAAMDLNFKMTTIKFKRLLELGIIKELKSDIEMEKTYDGDSYKCHRYVFLIVNTQMLAQETQNLAEVEQVSRGLFNAVLALAKMPEAISQIPEIVKMAQGIAWIGLTSVIDDPDELLKKIKGNTACQRILNGSKDQLYDSLKGLCDYIEKAANNKRIIFRKTLGGILSFFPRSVPRLVAECLTDKDIEETMSQQI